MAVEKGKYVFTWKVENFSFWLSQIPSTYSSPTFKAETIGGSKWYLVIFSPNDQYVKCRLHKISDDENESVNFCVKLIGNDGETLGVWEEVVVGRGSLQNNEFVAVDTFYEKMKSWKEDILTLRCTIFGDSVLISNPACESIAWTKIAIDRCCFSWNIDISDNALCERRKVFMSKNIYFEITLTSPTDDIEINIRDLVRNYPKSELCLVSCKMSLISVNGVEIATKSCKDVFHRKFLETNFEFSVFLSKQDLQTKAHDLMQNKSYTLKCEICASENKTLTEIKAVKYKDPLLVTTCLNDSILALQEDLRKMLKSCISSDVKLNVGNQMIPVNTCILRARSPYFYRTIDTDATIFKITGLDVEILNLLLEFIYTGSVNDLNFENSKELLETASAGEIPSLINKCSSFLISQLSVGNVCELYTLANSINNNRLKKSAFKFIEKNAAEVFWSKVWSEWMASDFKLANEILSKLTRNFLK